MFPHLFGFTALGAVLMRFHIFYGYIVVGFGFHWAWCLLSIISMFQNGWGVFMWGYVSLYVIAFIYYLVVLFLVVFLFRRWREPVIIASFYIASYVLSQYLAAKLTTLGPYVVPAGTVAFVATIALADLMIVNIGLSYARKIIITGFVIQIPLFIINNLVVLSPDPFPGFEWKYYVLWTSARVAVASPIAYLASEMINAQLTWIYRSVPWKRTAYSDPISLIIDTLIFIPAAFYGNVPEKVLQDMIIGQVTAKVSLTPLNLLAIYINRFIVEKYIVVGGYHAQRH